MSDVSRLSDAGDRHEQLRSMMMGYKLSRSIYVAARLKIADLLVNGPRSVEELAQATESDAGSLHRLLRFLAAAGFFTEDDEAGFGLTPLGELLASGRTGSDWAWVLKEGELWWEAWMYLLDCVRTGQPGFDLAYGKGLFDYLEDVGTTQIASQTLLALTSAGSDAQVRSIREAYDFGAFGTVVDVGGGNGALLIALLSEHPRLRGVLFDLPYVVSLARSSIQAAGVTERCQQAGGSFFESVPGGGDLYLLRSVLHDWDDARALEILRSCRRAMSDQARLLVVEVLKPGDNQASTDDRFAAALRDVNLMVMTSGRKRTAEEHADLLAAAKFEIRQTIPTKGHFCILEAVVARG